MAADPVTCFAEGTNIRTADGERPVETLRVGDLVWTARDEYKPIKWVGKRHIRFEDLSIDDAARHKPVLFKKDCLCDGVPHRDLMVSGPHGIAIETYLVPASRLVNNVSVVRLNDVEEVTYYHVELDCHEAIFAEGVSAETFVDVGNRAAFDNGADADPCTGSQSFVNLCGTPLNGGPELERMRRIINRRAAALFVNKVA